MLMSEEDRSRKNQSESAITHSCADVANSQSNQGTLSFSQERVLSSVSTRTSIIIDLIAEHRSRAFSSALTAVEEDSRSPLAAKQTSPIDRPLETAFHPATSNASPIPLTRNLY